MKSTFNFSPLKESKKIVDAIAGEVATAEAEIVLAEEALAAAKRDDGSIAPEKLVERIHNADRLVKIRRIEANRAAAKLEEVEVDFHRMIHAAVQPVIENLISKVEDEKVRLREAMKNILGDSVGDTLEVTKVIGMSEPVIRIGGHTQDINRAKLDIAQGFTGTIETLIEKVIGAEQLL